MLLTKRGERTHQLVRMFYSETTCRNLMKFDGLFARIIRMSVQLIVARIGQTYRTVITW